MKGVGVVMEPTPPVALGGGGSARRAEPGDKPPTAEEALAEKPEETVEKAGSEVERIALVLMAVFGMLAVGSFLFRGARKGNTPEEQDGSSRTKRKGGYFGLWRLACEKKGLAGSAGWTLKRQIAEMDAPPAFADELREYHYALRYEEKPPDADREGRLVSEIKGWDQAGSSKPLR
jgi:hypothetical protein